MNQELKEIMTYILDVLIDIINGIFSDAPHGKSLPTTCLPIGENCCCREKGLASETSILSDKH